MGKHERDHWESIYAAKTPDRVSWYRPHLDRSLAFLDAASLTPDAAVIDVGGGASTFVDDLLDRGLHHITVLDIAAAALDASRARLGPRGSGVRWICADVLDAPLPAGAFDLWHDRAAFHFLTEPAARAAYVRALTRALKPGGHVVIATFAPDGPEKCSGLAVQHLSPEGIHAELGAAFELLAGTSEVHETPWGSEQSFSYCFARLRASDAS